MKPRSLGIKKNNTYSKKERSYNPLRTNHSGGQGGSKRASDAEKKILGSKLAVREREMLKWKTMAWQPRGGKLERIILGKPAKK